jgi:hypothetical protein
MRLASWATTGIAEAAVKTKTKIAEMKANRVIVFILDFLFVPFITEQG